jgi:radical SAM superfamily enzyme YgiQ (UPF0313 family)
MEPLRHEHKVRFLLIGPHDPHCGEYTFIAPPLGVWRVAGVLRAHGIETEVFDPNCCESEPMAALEATLRSGKWDLIGVSTTAMTLRYDLSLAHLARRLAPKACLVAGGMEATFKPERLFDLGPPFDLVVLGEGEKPLLEIAARLKANARLDGIPGTALCANDGTVIRFRQTAMTSTELAAAVRSTPYDRMPYSRYWDRLEGSYEVGRLPIATGIDTVAIAGRLRALGVRYGQGSAFGGYDALAPTLAELYG